MTQGLNSENMKLAPGVVDTIVSLTASEQEGVASVGGKSKNGPFSKLSSKPSTSGIECVADDEGNISVALHIDVYYGFSIPDVADKLRQSIADALSVQAGLNTAKVDIYVDGIQFNQN